jgi:hypothetical protein
MNMKDLPENKRKVTINDWDFASNSFKDIEVTVPTFESLIETVSPELRVLIEAEMALPENANSTLQRSGWTSAALKAAYQNVKPEKPRGPIDSIIPDTDVDITTEAIDYIAGGFVECYEVKGKPNHTNIVAPGYFAVIGP